MTDPHHADPAAALPSNPRVGVIMPILNEERHIAEAVGAILAQDAPAVDEVVLALGPSRDRTAAIAAELAAGDARVRLVQSPSGRTPDSLNAAIAGLSPEADVVVRVDGHGVLSPGYVATALRLLRETGAANVGGIMQAEGVTPFERAVARAMTSRLGVGASAFHVGGEPGPTETVYLGVFRREWLARTGGYDPRFSRAQDWELNHRIRELGGVVWFSPELQVAYRPRPTLAALARQYRDYGRWRRVVARTHAGTMNARYLAPPLALLAIAGGLVGGFLWAPLWVVPVGYAAAVTLGGLAIGGGLTLRERAYLPLILPTMHLPWGWGFLTSRVSIKDR